jgi:hypothetical protein
MDVTTLWRAALLQLAAVAALSIALGLALPHDFFVDWGWIAGPATWMLCAAFTAKVLSLPLVPTLTGAVLAACQACSPSSSPSTGPAPSSPLPSSPSGAPAFPPARPGASCTHNVVVFIDY